MSVKNLVWFSILLVSAMSDARQQTVRIYKFTGTCPGYGNAPVIFKDIRISLVNRMYVISMKVVSRRPVPGGLKLKLSLKRCQSRDALDSCEKYQTVTVNRLCDLINSNNKPWSPFASLAQPPFGCPITKSVHVVNNGTFDGSAFSHLPISGWYWIVMAKVLSESTDELVLCMTMEGQLAPI